MEISVPTFEISLSFEIGELDYCVSWTKNETTIEHVEEVDDTELEQKDFDTAETNNAESKITEKFVLKLSGGERSVKMSSVIEGSSEPVFKEESAAMSVDEIQDFKKAWIDALLMCLERRIAGGISPEDLTLELLDDLGVNNFKEILQHFLAEMLVANSIELSSS